MPPAIDFRFHAYTRKIPTKVIVENIQMHVTHSLEESSRVFEFRGVKQALLGDRQCMTSWDGRLYPLNWSCLGGLGVRHAATVCSAKFTGIVIPTRIVAELLLPQFRLECLLFTDVILSPCGSVDPLEEILGYIKHRIDRLRRDRLQVNMTDVGKTAEEDTFTASSSEILRWTEGGREAWLQEAQSNFKTLQGCSIYDDYLVRKISTLLS